MALGWKKLAVIAGASLLILTACDAEKPRKDTGTVTYLKCHPILGGPDTTVILDKTRKYRMPSVKWCEVPVGAKVKINYNDKLMITELDYVKEAAE